MVSTEKFGGKSQNRHASVTKYFSNGYSDFAGYHMLIFLRYKIFMCGFVLTLIDCFL
jgi:hypothetical protein